MASVFSDKIIAQATKHAREVFPEEACGIVARGTYVRSENMAADPAHHEEGNDDCECRLCSFIISPKIINKHLSTLEGIIHSHPNGPNWPSRSDMLSQMETDVPWMIIPLSEDRVSKPIIWGEGIAPIIGREFIHGVADCYTLIRDVFALGKDALAEQGITGWPYEPIQLEEVARQQEWWNKGESLYLDEYERIGFTRVNSSEARPGDVFLLPIRSSVPNHSGVLAGNDLIIHHLPERLSRREPFGLWGSNAEVWLRYVGSKDA